MWPRGERNNHMIAVCESSFILVTVLNSLISLEGVQNRPPQDVRLWHVNYFELKAIETL